MKRSYIIASLIILAGVIISWPDLQKITRAKENNTQLIKAAATPSTANDQEQSQKNPRKSRDTESATDGKALAHEYINILRLSKGYKNPQNPSETYSYERKRALHVSIYNLSLSQIKSFFAEFNLIADPSELSESDISNQTKYLMSLFAEKYPTEMVDLLIKSPEIFNNDSKRIDNSLFSIIYYIAHDKNDPTITFQILPQLDARFQSQTISILFGASESPEKRTETLNAMRAYATTPEQRELVMKHMSVLAFGNSSRIPFAEASNWLKSAALSTEELSVATMGMEKKVRTGDTAQWLDWISASDLPDEVSQVRAFLLATEWTKKDYQAVGQWLNNAPDGPEKHAAIGAYAINTYPHDPENSMKWAQTLPGRLRSNCLRLIYGTMPKDSDAAKAFASEHGIN